MGGRQLKVGDKVVIEMGSELDGEMGRVIGVNTEDAVKTYYAVRINSVKKSFWLRRGDFKVIKGD